MMSSRVRDIMRQSRRDLHREMCVPALYIPVADAYPLPLTVRPHDLPSTNGKPGGSAAAGYAQQVDVKPSLVFLTEEAPAMLRVNAIVSIEPGEAYRISFVHPPHGITITADVVKLSAAEAADLPVPSDG